MPGSTGTTGFTYSVQNELLAVTRPDGQVVTLAYDSAGRVNAVVTPEGVDSIGFDAVTGQVTALAAPGGVSQALRYDGPLPTGTTWSGPVSGSVDFTYGAYFRPRNILVNGQELAPYRFFRYDHDGLPTQIGDLYLGYRAENGLLDYVAGAGQVSFLAYDSLGQVARYAVLSWVTPDTTYRAAYTYDRLGRITQLAERVLADTTTYAFAYDSAGRLAEVQRGGVVTAAYEYDLNGNRTRRTTGAGTEVGTYDDQDRLLSYGAGTYAYTANGELRLKVVGTDTTRYRYDAFGNLREVWLPDGTHVEYVIDGQQRRIGRKVNGALTHGWLYLSQLAIAAEVDGLGNVTKTFEYATRVNVPDVMRVGGTLYRIITDHLGSVRLVVNASTGQVAQRLDYDEYGRVVLNTNPGFQPFGYAGGLLDEATGLVRFGARDYDAVAGRWTASDASLFLGGDPNLYAYSLGDPIGLSDSDGRRVEFGTQRLNNPLVRENLERLNSEIIRLGGLRDEDFVIRVSGGDRYRDPKGRIRSSTDDRRVRNSSRMSTHLISRGARGLDVVYEGISDELFDLALRCGTDFNPGRTNRNYPNAPHTHIQLPFGREYWYQAP